MSKPQARISKAGKLYFDRLELINYVLDVEDRWKEKGIKTRFHLRRATDGSYIYLLNDKVIGQDHPGVPGIPGEAGDVPKDEFYHTHDLKTKKASRKKRWASIKYKVRMNSEN